MSVNMQVQDKETNTNTIVGHGVCRFEPGFEPVGRPKAPKNDGSNRGSNRLGG